MAHIYMHFDFGADEEKAQEARHKLDGWKQAFRLDKKLQYKLERPEDADEEEAAADDDSSSAQKSSGKTKPKSSTHKKSGKESSADTSGNVSLLVRLYFSSHEKLSAQRWIDRIPTEEPFKAASPKILRQGDKGFDAAVKQFADLD
jgi:hypothetical protein